ncbi:MAG: sulfatase-like hydrolase/transferase, partial [Candidatus Latescibacterota bacterium]
SGDSADHPMTVGAIKGFRCEEIGEQEMMNARAAYFACVDFLDEMIGDFLALLQRDGLLDNTIIVYTSDHGEMAGEHGLFWKNT